MSRYANRENGGLGFRVAWAAAYARLGRLALTLGLLVCAAQSALAGPPNCPNAGMVLNQAKISDTAGGFTGVLDNEDEFGRGVANIGDLDGDGVIDLAVGADTDDDGGENRGAVWIFFMNSDGSVRAHQKISSTAGGFAGPINNFVRFGGSVAGLGDLDGDNIPDLAVGAPFDTDGGSSRGAVWILFLNANGTVRAHQKISDLVGGLVGALDNSDIFGIGVANLGDLDGDDLPDIAVGAAQDDDGGGNRGAVWILFLNANGTVRAEQKVSDFFGGFGGVLDNEDLFGRSVAGVGDLDGDGIPDLAVGANGDDDGGTSRGAVWILFMNANGTVRADQKISDTAGGFNGVLNNSDQFGIAVGGPGDLDGDGIPDLAVGEFLDNDGGLSAGALWILLMNADGTVKADQKISSTVGGFVGPLRFGDLFGSSIAGLGDLNGDGYRDLAVGAYHDDDGDAMNVNADRGAVWILSLDGCAAAPACCAGNADGLGGVNFADITSVLTNFGAAGTPGVQNPGDADCNGVVNFADITEVLTNFNSGCP